MAADTGLQTRLKFAGQQYNQEVGLYSMRARYYDPQLGRFLSEDPIGIAGGLNLYAYAGNDPVNLWDPSGLGPLDPCTDANGVAGRFHRDGKTCVTWVPRLDDIEINSGSPEVYDLVTIARGMRGGNGATWSNGSAPREKVSATNAAQEERKACYLAIGNIALQGALDLLLPGVKQATNAVRLASRARSLAATSVHQFDHMRLAFRQGSRADASVRFGAGLRVHSEASALSLEADGLLAAGIGGTIFDASTARTVIELFPGGGTVLAVNDMITKCF